jgi:hypothetical protein
MELDDLGELRNESGANLVWDEHKYPHDLIWRHLIRLCAVSRTASVSHHRSVYSLAFGAGEILWCAILFVL